MFISRITSPLKFLFTVKPLQLEMTISPNYGIFSASIDTFSLLSLGCIQGEMTEMH